jgi:hypothetical protein
MKRYSIIKSMLKVLHENDILIFSGPELCKEANEHHADNHFYLNDFIGMAIPIGLGMAMCTDKRVFVFVGEGELLRDLNVLPQIGASKCRNMFLVVLANGGYQASGSDPNVFDGLLSKKGFIYNANIKVLEFTRHFRDRKLNILKNRFERLTGPTAILLTLDRGNKKSLEDINIDFEEQKNKISSLIADLSKETALYMAPAAVPLPANKQEEPLSLDIDSLQIGGIS